MVYQDPETAASNISKFFALNSNTSEDRISRKKQLESETHMPAGPSTSEYLNHRPQTSAISFMNSCQKKTDKTAVTKPKKKRRKIKMISNASQTSQESGSECEVNQIVIKPGMP